MPDRSFTLDPQASRLLVHTRAEGLLARLAHALQLSTPELTGTATLEGEAWTADLRVPVRSLMVDGVLHGDTLDRTVLSAADREQILTKMREDIFGDATEIEARAAGPGRDRGEATVRVGRASQRAPLTFTTREAESGALQVTGTFEVSIKALGGKAIKGPLGAFSVKDTVKLRFDLRLVPTG
ncbi:MAG: hypothetical protein ABI193_22195 [Minicystis sp.]